MPDTGPPIPLSMVRSADANIPSRWLTLDSVYFYALTTLMCLVLGWDGLYSRLDGLILFGSFLLYMVYLYIDERQHYKATENGYSEAGEAPEGVAATRRALDQFRQRTRAAGFAGLHLNAVVWGQPLLPGESTPADPARLVGELGFDSVTSYVWVHHAGLGSGPTVSYRQVRDEYFAYWERARDQYARFIDLWGDGDLERAWIAEARRQTKAAEGDNEDIDFSYEEYTLKHDSGIYY